MARASLTIGDLVYKLGFQNEEEFVASLDGVLNQADEKLEKEGREAGRKGGAAASRGFDQQFRATFRGAALGSFVGMALERAFASAVGAATKFAADSVREFAVYEQGLLQLKLAGETNLGALSKRIQDTAKATKVFSATDVSLAVGALVKAGYDAETAFALVETGALGASAEVDAATGKFGDLTSTSKQLGNILRALDLDTSQTGRVMDVLARAAQDSNLNVSDLVEIVSRVGPTAKLAGLEIEDLAAMAGVLANNGMEASLIGTGLRSVLQSLINPSGQVKGQLDALGVSLVDSNGNLRDFSTVLDGLHELTERGGEGLQLLTAATGSFGSAAAANLGSASEEVKRFRATLGDAEGTAQELADTMRNSAAGAFAEMEARIKDAKAELGEQMMPVLLTLYESVFPPLVGILGELIQKWTDWEFIITGTTAAIKRQQEALAEQVRSGLGPELGQALLDLQNAQQAVIDAEQRLASVRIPWGWDKMRAQQALDAAREELAIAQERYDLLLANRQQQQLVGSFTFDGQDALPFGPLLPGQARAQAAAGKAVAESFRNLAAVEAELAEARAAWAAAGSAEEEARWAAEVRRLEAEKKAKQAAVETAKASAAAVSSAARVERDEIIDEASSVQADLQRLKLAREQELVSRSWYEEQLEAHLRRLDGLRADAENPQQALAVLRARKAFLDELLRLEEQAAKEMEAVRAVNKDREDEQRFPSTLTGEGVAQLKRRIANRERAIAQAEQEAREEAMAAGYRASQHRVQAQDDRPSITGVFQTPEDVRRWVEEQNRAEVEAEKKKQAELTRLREEAQENIAKIAGENRARVRAVEEDARRLGIAVSQELRAGTLEGLQALEAELVELLSEMGDDPSAAPLLGLLTRTRAAIDNQTEAARAAESEQRRLIRAHNEYTESLKRARQAEIDRAMGSTVRLTQAQRTLGLATRDEVITAVEEQIATIGRLLPTVAEGSERYYDLVAALEAARAALDALNAEVPEFRMPDLGSAEAIRRAFSETESMLARLRERVATETDQSVIALLEVRIQQYTELLRQLGIAVADLDQAAADGATGDEIQKQAAALSSDIMRIAESFPRAIAEGIRSGDIAGALEQALGGAADYFLDMTLKSILGPITEELTAAIAKSLTAKAATDGATGATGALGALGPTGLVIGGLALVASMLVGAGRQRQAATERNQQNVRAAVSGAPSVTYNLTGNVTVNSNAAWSDPAFTARWRSETEALLVSLLSKVRR